MANRITRIIFFVLGLIFSAVIVAVVVLSSLGVFKGESVARQDLSGEYYITNYTTDITVNKDNSLLVEEEISVHFVIEKHGIFRALPEVSTVQIFDNDGNIVDAKKMRFNIELEFANKTYAVSSENDIYYIRLGSEYSLYSAGENETFRIKYTTKFDSRYAEYNQFYYNVLGNLWDTSIDSFTATINFAEGVPTEKSKAFFGKFGESNPVDIDWSNDETTATITKTNIEYGEGISLFTSLPSNYFVQKFAHTIDLINLFAILLIAFIVILIYRKNSNKTIITPVVQFKVDKKYTSADVGYIIDKKVNNKDIASLFIMWASKGYLEIIEEGKKTYIRKLKDVDEGMKQYEKNLFIAIFGMSTEKIDIKSIGDSIVDTIQTTKADIITENKKFFNEKANIKRNLMAILTFVVFAITLVLINYQNCDTAMLIISILMAVVLYATLILLASNRDKQFIAKDSSKLFKRLLLFIVLGVALVVCIATYDVYCDFTFNSFIVFALVCITVYTTFNFSVRTDEGAKEFGDILGVKNFILATEQNRLEIMVKNDPSIFFDIMPYAYVLDIYDEWCKRFEKIVIDAPSWYTTTSTDIHFNAFIFSSALNSINASVLHSINSAEFAKMQQSMNSNGGGGFSGGGFSGGGFGGGGGGSW